jgi:hypothetical protein
MFRLLPVVCMVLSLVAFRPLLGDLSGAQSVWFSATRCCCRTRAFLPRPRTLVGLDINLTENARLAPPAEQVRARAPRHGRGEWS